MENILNKKKSLMISSIDENGRGAISYAPFIREGNNLYIYISKTAPHYKNIANNKEIDVMVIEDESEAKSIWARERISFRCNAFLEEKEEEILPIFEKEFEAGIFGVLKTLDFNVFRLEIIDGRVIKGFGQAFSIEVTEDGFKYTQVVGDGHKK